MTANPADAPPPPASRAGQEYEVTRQLQRQQRQDEGTAIPIAIANGGTIIADAYSAA